MHNSKFAWILICCSETHYYNKVLIENIAETNASIVKKYNISSRRRSQKQLK